MNRRYLYNMMQTNALDNNMYLSKFSKEEKNRGRFESRTVEVYQVNDSIKKAYPHSKSVILVKRQRTVKGNTSNEVVYYLSDLTLDAKEFAQGIRGHWSIENKLHWVKDKVMNEDKANLKNKKIAPIFSIFRSFVITFAKYFGYNVTSFQRAFAHDLSLIELL